MDWNDGLLGVSLMAGRSVSEWILGIAGLLRDPSAPGLACVGLVLALVVFSTMYIVQIQKTRAAIKNATAVVRSASDAKEFHGNFPEISNRLRKLRAAKGRSRKLGIAWLEYEETLENDPEAGAVHNTVRPSAYFNREDLGLEDGFWRHLPALYVSVGLFLTFVGLVAALGAASDTLNSATDGSSGKVTNALIQLLGVASAKFIMSLTGLFCSILFTLELRIGTVLIDGCLLDLCEAIEERVRFRTAEGLLFSLHQTTEEQTDQLKALVPEIVAHLGQPLREAADKQVGQIESLDANLTSGLQRLGNTIGEILPAAIEKSLQPILQRLEADRQSGTQQMADALSGRLTAGMKDALDQMGSTLQNVGHTLSGLADRMDQSAGSMSGQIDAAVAALANQIGELSHTMSQSTGHATRVLNEGADRLLARMDETLVSIRDNTSRGGEALERAATTLQGATQSLAENIEAQGREASGAASRAVQQATDMATSEMSTALGNVVNTLQSTMPSLVAEAGKFAQAFQGDLVTPLTDLRSALDQLRREVESGTAQSARHANAVANSAASIEMANDQVSSAAHALSDAATPLAGAAERMEGVNRELRQAIEGAVDVLDTTLKGMRAPQDAALQVVRALKDAIDEFSEVVGRYEEIDRAIGSVLAQVRNEIQHSVGEMTNFSERLNQEFGRSLSTLRSVVQQIEPYSGPMRRVQ